MRRPLLSTFYKEPIAQLVTWECKYSHNDKLTSTCPVVVSDDNRLEIEFTPTVSGRYSFQLIPTGCPTVGIQKFTLTAHSNNPSCRSSPYRPENIDSLEVDITLSMLENDIQQRMPEDTIQPPMAKDSIPLRASYGLIPPYSSLPTLSSNSKVSSKLSPPSTSSSGLTLPISSTSATSNYRKPIIIGARVKRGPDWNHLAYDNQDGGVGNFGTVVGRSIIRNHDFVVRWDGKTTTYNYRWGSENKYELELVSW